MTEDTELTEQIDDPLKPFEEILKPDIRSAYSPVRTLEVRHQELAQIVISDAAPIGVKQLFETAKNLALYSWFVYRFHQPAELCAFGAIEMALREKAKRDAPDWWKAFPKERPPMLWNLLDKARREGWIGNEGFSHWRRRQQLAAYNSALAQQLDEMIKNQLDEASAPRVEDFEGHIGDPSYDYFRYLVTSIPVDRNLLAHGSGRLLPTSIGTLEISAELINQLF